VSIVNTKRLIEARGERSRKDVAAIIGVSRQQIWNYEKGISEPPLSVLIELANLYNVNYTNLITQKNFVQASN